MFMKPMIGVTLDWEKGVYQINETYIKAIIEAGGIPVCLPYVEEEDGDKIIQAIDGLLLTGGGDIHPFFFGEEPKPKLGRVITKRDEREIQWTKLALQRNIPILGICRGLQILNVALGGTIYQDIYAEYKGERLLHTQTCQRNEASHFVTLQENSKLKQILKAAKIQVNSFHHQAINEVANDLEVVGTASDGIIEAVEHKTSPFCIGVQWHPEAFAIEGIEQSKTLFQAFIEACKNA